MPFLKSHSPTSPTAPASPHPPPPAPAPVVEEKRGLFGRKKTVVHHNDNDKRKSVIAKSPTSPTTHTNPVQRLDEINSVLPAAREKVRLAEVAEDNARAALIAAEKAVVEARRHVSALEQEAKEQARLAELAARQAQAKLNEFDNLKKKTDKMGRI
ncbi:hypothetical protein P389DRAFT_8590 [Cystobasidium minutum MCA 4210]|uniref:uncharacterized protein n=1 Tax=Cystobasidium minutum MCA 4210 TaxID=1397322 RepID=UPI0034CFD5C8|eukprot:jgi/Rhomi1/8590/CE8589_92